MAGGSAGLWRAPLSQPRTSRRSQAISPAPTRLESRCVRTHSSRLRGRKGLRRRRHAFPGSLTFSTWRGRYDVVNARWFRGTARTATRKAERASLRVECGTHGRHLDAFYDLYRRSIKRWARQTRKPVWFALWQAARRDPPEKFASVAERMGEQCRTWVAWHGDTPAAALICLVHGESASYWRGCMDKQIAGPTRANYLLHKLAIEDACASGCRYYHMGETGASSLLAQFKAALGAQPHRYAEYRFGRFAITRGIARGAAGASEKPQSGRVVRAFS
jgi:hypothetical protein